MRIVLVGTLPLTLLIITFLQKRLLEHDQTFLNALSALPQPRDFFSPPADGDSDDQDRLVVLNREFLDDTVSILDNFTAPILSLPTFHVTPRYTKGYRAAYRLLKAVDVPRYPNVLVMYSGPTRYVAIEPHSTSGRDHKTYLYQRNFDYFLDRLECLHDVVIVLTQETASVYRYRLRQLDQHCQATTGHRVWMRIRSPHCYDMESFRTAIRTVDTSRYEYFVYINCGTVGPHPSFGPHWTSVLLSALTPKVKLTGLTVNCQCHYQNITHVQSMVFATDRTGWDIISKVPYDCLKRKYYHQLTEQADVQRYISKTYECRMSQRIVEAGYQVQGILHGQAVADKCNFHDILSVHTLSNTYGKRPELQELLFYKNSRTMDEKLLQELGMKKREVRIVKGTDEIWETGVTLA